MAVKSPSRTKLIAPCGMDCSICSAYLRTKNHCEGCAATNLQHRRNCTIALCGKRTGRYCDCPDIPCRRLKQLDKRYRTKYHISMLDNLAAIHKDGIRAFVRSERDRWKCMACGGTIDVHHYRCSVCGKEPE